MKVQPTTIWMNVTTSHNWQRPPVGIVRVERSLRDELAKLYGPRFKQCLWQGERFVEYFPSLEDSNNAESEGEQTLPFTPSIRSNLPPIFTVLPRRQALLELGRSLYSLSPGAIRPFFNRLLYRFRPYLRRLLSSKRLKHFLIKMHSLTKASNTQKLIQTITQSSAPNSKELFSAGDILLSVGLDWDHPYYKNFYALRKELGVKVVTCCYDLIPVIFPQYCVQNVANLFTSYFLEVADGSDLVLCISKQSERDFNEMLNRTGGAHPATHVFPLGDNVPEVKNLEISQSVRQICDVPFILFVSTIERRKNHEVLYRAYHLLCKQGKKQELPKLVFVGMPGWGVNELFKDIELDPFTSGMIVKFNHVNDSELRLMYESSLFCVFPSLYEGWGLPVGEALSIGKAVLCSDRGSLPEVGGDLVRYVDPWIPKNWADEIYKMATDDAWRNFWENKAKNGYKARSWSGAAVSIKNSLDSLS